MFENLKNQSLDDFRKNMESLTKRLNNADDEAAQRRAEKEIFREFVWLREQILRDEQEKFWRSLFADDETPSPSPCGAGTAPNLVNDLKNIASFSALTNFLQTFGLSNLPNLISGMANQIIPVQDDLNLNMLDEPDEDAAPAP